MTKPVAIITGAAGGMGEACVELYAQDHQVIASDVSAEKLDILSRRMRQKGAVIYTVVCDISKAEDVKTLISTAATAGKISAIVHTAGLSPTMADGRTIMDINLKGTALLLEELTPYMTDGATAVCIASQAGTFAALQATSEITQLLQDPLQSHFLEKLESAMGNPLTSDDGYGLGKLGVQLLVQKYAFGWGSKNARIVSISPGMIDTPMIALEFKEKPGMQMLLAETPLGRVGKAHEIAATARFLCSADASFITGVDLLVDGGATHRVINKLISGEVSLDNFSD